MVGGGFNEETSETELFVGSGVILKFSKLNLYPLFGRAAKILRFHTPKIAKVGLRMKVEIVQIQFFSEKISIFRATFSKN